VKKWDTGIADTTTTIAIHKIATAQRIRGGRSIQFITGL
jgi:hypothetical protein